MTGLVTKALAQLCGKKELLAGGNEGGTAPVSSGLKNSNVPTEPVAEEAVNDADSRRLTFVYCRSGDRLSAGLTGVGAMIGAGIARGGNE